MRWINLAECGVQSPHEPHSWREGFLWHRKHSCKGLSHIEAVSVRDEQLKRAIKSGLYGKLSCGRHFYRIKWVDNTKLMFECERCQYQNPMDRSMLYRDLLGFDAGSFCQSWIIHRPHRETSAGPGYLFTCFGITDKEQSRLQALGLWPSN